MAATTRKPFQALDEAAASEISPAEAIQYHYDNDTRFFSLWLDETLSYSCARWSDPLTGAPLADTLAAAQREKIRHHLSAARVRQGERVLDIGCGWGAVLSAAIRDFGAAEAVGLTLSHDQLDHITGKGEAGVTALLQDVFAFESRAPFQAAVSIGAFEHFARPEMGRAEKIARYAAFFGRLAGMLSPGARFSLQTIVWDTVSFDEAKTMIPQTVFPQSDLPFIEEIVAGSQHTFRLVHLENDGMQYARTLSAWIDGLKAARADVVSRWGEGQYAFFERYLRTSRVSFQREYTSLARLVLERR